MGAPRAAALRSSSMEKKGKKKKYLLRSRWQLCCELMVELDLL
jgi:hypothetical protein